MRPIRTLSGRLIDGLLQPEPAGAQVAHRDHVSLPFHAQRQAPAPIAEHGRSLVGVVVLTRMFGTV